MQTQTNLAEHELFQQVINDLRPFLDIATKEFAERVSKTGEIRPRGQRALPPREYYLVDIFRRIHLLLGGVDRLVKAIIFIQRFPSPRAFTRQGINQYEWLEYHYSYFVITYVSLFDTALILTNTIFRLGNPPKNCRAEIIRENEWVKSTGVKQALERLEKTITPYRPIRNLHMHRGEVPDIKDVGVPEILDLLQFIDTAKEFKELQIEQNDITSAFQGQITLIQSRLEEAVEQVKEDLMSLFDSLLPVYKENIRGITYE